MSLGRGITLKEVTSRGGRRKIILWRQMMSQDKEDDITGMGKKNDFTRGDVTGCGGRRHRDVTACCRG